MAWFRVSVDFDTAGNPVGRSYEAHDDNGELVALCHSGTAPFDDAFECFGATLAEVRNQFGLQVTLF